MAVAAYEYDDAISIADVDCLSSQDRAGVQCSRHRGLENLPEGEYQIIFLLFFFTDCTITNQCPDQPGGKPWHLGKLWGEVRPKD